MCCEDCDMWCEFAESGVIDRDFSSTGKGDFKFVCKKCSWLLEIEVRLGSVSVSGK